MFKLIVDTGKPSEEVVKDEVELKKRLTELYHEQENEPFDVFVFRGEEDISESQFISEMIGEIMESDNDV